MLGSNKIHKKIGSIWVNHVCTGWVYLKWILDKVFKNGPCKICGRQPLKTLKGYDLLADHIPSNIFNAAFHKFYLVHSWVLSTIRNSFKYRPGTQQTSACSKLTAYLFKHLPVQNRSSRKACEMCSKLTIKTPEWRQWHRSSVFIFKACVRYFLANFYSSPNDSPSKTMKDVFCFI